MRAIQNRLLRADALRLSDVINRPIVDVVITSPPYADLKDYGVKGQIGYGQRYAEEYIPALKRVFEQCYRVTKETGSLWLVIDTFRKKGEVTPLPFDVADICREGGWILSDIIIWDKGRTLPWSHKGRLRNIFEYILFFVKSSDHKYYDDRIKDPTELKQWWVKYPERYSFGGKNPSNIWRIPIPVQGSWAANGLRHFCPFPPELVERILLLTTDVGDVVLDPFAGSGIVLAQAMCMKRRFIGLEINPSYVDSFKEAVVPLIQEHWAKTQAEMRGLERRRTEFEHKIAALRVLKYPKSLVKGVQKRMPFIADSIDAIVVDRLRSKPSQSTKFARVRVTLLVQNKVNVNTLRRELEWVSTKPPASKYGIQSEFVMCSASEFAAGFRGNGRRKRMRLYAYLGGRTHYYDEEIRGSDLIAKIGSDKWRSSSKLGVPPIVCAIGLRQEIAKSLNDDQLEPRG